MFYLHYLFSELRRRPGRTALTALGLGVGIGLVVIVGALSAGLDDAQDEVLEPLTGVGTDLSVSRPISVPEDTDGGVPSGDPFSQLSPREQRQLDRENKGHDAAFNYSELGEPGERFSEAMRPTCTSSSGGCKGSGTAPDASIASSCGPPRPRRCRDSPGESTVRSRAPRWSLPRTSQTGWAVRSPTPRTSPRS